MPMIIIHIVPIGRIQPNVDVIPSCDKGKSREMALQHAVQGWCPPLAVWRRLGVRTQSEIDEERYALKALRGDFRDVRPPSEGDGWLEVREACRAARRS